MTVFGNTKADNLTCSKFCFSFNKSKSDSNVLGIMRNKLDVNYDACFQTGFHFPFGHLFEALT